MNVKFSPELFLFLKHFDASTISFDIVLPVDIQEDLGSATIPDNFAYFIDSTSFLANYWNTLSTLIVVFVFTLVLVLLAFLLKKQKQNEWYLIIHRMKFIAGSNMIILIFCGTYDEIALFASL